MHRHLRRSTVGLLSLAGALIAAEFCVRALNPFGIALYEDNGRYLRKAIRVADLEEEGRLFEHRPGVDVAMHGFHVRTDAVGLRSTRSGASVPAADGSALRILFLGDSSTLGWGVEDEHTWVRQLEGRVRAADGRPLVCLNGGHLMYDTVQEAAWLRARGPELAPDVVVLVFNSNDLNLTWQVFQSVLAKADSTALVERETGWLKRALESAGTFFRGMRGLALLYEQKKALQAAEAQGSDALLRLPGYPQNWPRCQAKLEEIRATCAELGAQLVVLDHARPRVTELRLWCSERGVAWMDLAFSQAESRWDIRISAADAHANDLGNGLMAIKARRGLAALGILAPDTEGAPTPEFLRGAAGAAATEHPAAAASAPAGQAH